MTVWRNFSTRFGGNYLVDIEKDPLWISIYGTKLIEIGPRTCIWGEPLKDIGNLRRFLQTVSDRIAGKEAGQEALSPEESEKTEVE